MITVLVAVEDLMSAEVVIRGESYRHLFRSRRLPSGSRLRLVDGLGGARWATVEEVQSKSARLVCGEAAPRFEPRRTVSLLVAAPRIQRASWLVEKATELGVAEIRWLTTKRSVHRYREGNLERLGRVAAGALEQCHGCRLPMLSGMHSWEEIPTLAADCSSRWFLDPQAEPSPVAERGHSVALLVGPEGGLEDEERDSLLEWGWIGWSLGQRILRVETAAVIAAAAALEFSL